MVALALRLTVVGTFTPLLRLVVVQIAKQLKGVSQYKGLPLLPFFLNNRRAYGLTFTYSSISRSSQSGRAVRRVAMRQSAFALLLHTLSSLSLVRLTCVFCPLLDYSTFNMRSQLFFSSARWGCRAWSSQGSARGSRRERSVSTGSLSFAAT